MAASTDTNLALPLDDTEKNQAPRLGRDEMNLAEFPIAVLNKYAPEGVKTLIFKDTIRGKDGQEVVREWIVTGSDRWGLPTAVDDLVSVALMEVTREFDFQSREVPFTRYDLLRRLGWPPNGHHYCRLEESLNRLAGVFIRAKNAFWDVEKKSYVTVGFGILEGYYLYDEPPGRKTTDSPPPSSWILWNEVIFRSMQNGNIKYLDTDFFFSLKSYTAQRLYRHLDKRRYDGKPVYATDLEDLAFNHVGLRRPAQVFPSWIKQQLERPHQELIDRDFLKAVTYRPGTTGTIVEYRYAPRTRRQPTGRPPFSQPPCTEPDQVMIDRLGQQGVTKTVAERLVRTFPLAEIERQLEYLPYRPAQDPAAVLVKAIQEQWAAPAEYQQAREAEEKKKQAEEEQRHQEAVRVEQQRCDEERVRRIAAFKARLSPDELEALFEVALQVWSPAMQTLYREAGLEASLSQSLVENWIWDKYLPEEQE